MAKNTLNAANLEKLGPERLAALIMDLVQGSATQSLDSAAKYLERLEISHKVSVRDGAFTTTDLSTGQRKRLALINAWLEERPVLVFDEWAADQDPAFKNVFYREVLPELRRLGKGVLVIGMDISDGRNYDPGRMADYSPPLTNGNVYDSLVTQDPGLGSGHEDVYLWHGYDEDIASKVADINNASASAFAGAIIGALVLVSLQTGMVLIGFGDGSYRKIVIGAALVLAVYLDILYRKRIK